jgi:sugar/nucleoside kinase (ribokinase family)
MEKKKAVVVGHICIDITPQFPKIAYKNIPEILAPGKLINMDNVDISTGGAVANTGLAMKLLGIDTKLMGKVGNDEFGSLILHNIEKYGNTESMIVSNESNTSYSIVLAIPGIDRIFLHHPGANDTFTYHDMDWEAVKATSLFHFGYPPLMKKLYENKGDELVRIFKRAKELGVVTSLDMAAMDEGSEAGKADWCQILKRLLPFVDFFVPSIQELGFMLDGSLYEMWLTRAKGKDITEVITFDEIKMLGDRVLQFGAKLVLIKCGALGIYYHTSNMNDMSPICEQLGLTVTEWADKEGFEVSYVPKEVVSGTGAGDTSIAAFLAAVLYGESLSEALNLSVAMGACCVETYDALSGIKPFDELKEKIQKGWKKNDSKFE